MAFFSKFFQNFQRLGAVTYIGDILTSSDFPTLNSVQIGDMYRILADVTDDDPTKTDTGQSFLDGDEIYWDGDNWALFGSVELSSFSATSPITYNNTTGVFGLDYNTTNLKLTSNALNTIQDIATTSSPTFGGLTLTGLSGVLKASTGVISGSATTSDLPEGSNLYFTDERAQDAVGHILANSSTIQFTYDDAVPSIAADVRNTSITNAMLAGSIANDKLVNSSVTINGSSVSLGGSVTVTATASNALTINSPLSGGSYDGSSPVTIGLAAAYGDTQNPYGSKTANHFLSAPNGLAGLPTFRAIVAADLPTSQNIAKLTNLTSNGFVKTSGSDGTLSIDTNTYLTANQTITLSGDVSGSGSTSITTSIGSNKVTDAIIRQSAGLSLIGRSASTTGNVADITAASDFQVLRRSGSSIGFGAINLASTNAVTGTLPNSNTTATDANTALAIVARDGSGGFTAGFINVLTTGSATDISNLAKFSSNGVATAGNLYSIYIDKAGFEAIAIGINKNSTTGSVPSNSAFITTYSSSGTISIGRGGSNSLPSNADIFINSSGNVSIQTLTASKPVFTDSNKNLTSSGTVGTDQGGTNQNSSTWAQGDVPYISATGTWNHLPKNTTATRYLSNTGTNNNPAWSQINLTNGVTGTLPVANGGSGTATTFTPGSIIFAGASGVYTENNAALYWNNTDECLSIDASAKSNAIKAHFSGSITNVLGVAAYGIYNDVQISRNGALTSAINTGIYPNFAPPTGITYTNGVGLYIYNGQNAGVGNVTNAYSIYAETPTYGTNRYGAYFGGSVGIGITNPQGILGTYENNSNTGLDAGVTIEQDGSGDTVLHFVTTSTRSYSQGIYNSDFVNPYVFSVGNTLGTNNVWIAYSTAVMDIVNNFNRVNGYPAYMCRALVNFDGTANSNQGGTYSRSGTTITVTATNHGFVTGNIVYLDFTSGTATDGAFTVTSYTSNTFTVTHGTSGATSGNVTIVKSSIRSSGNVLAVADAGTGTFKVNLDQMPNANYSVAGSLQADSNYAVTIDGALAASSVLTTNSVPIMVTGSGGSRVDSSVICVEIFSV